MRLAKYEVAKYFEEMNFEMQIFVMKKITNSY